MKLSTRGLDMIKEFEGYHRAQPDGSCVAYRCPAGVLTIGWGCTEGVKENMRWTRADAEARLLAELARHESAVERMTTVALNQNQFDALVSFSYNLGTGALQKSTLLKRVNETAWEAAGQEFGRWTKAAGMVLPGLVARRGKEAALFLEPVQEPVEPTMPQAVEIAPSTRPLPKSGTVWGGIAAGGAATAGYAESTMKGALEAVSELNTMAPVKSVILETGANSKAVALGLGVFAAILVISRRVKAAVEGRSG